METIENLKLLVKQNKIEREELQKQIDLISSKYSALIEEKSKLVEESEKLSWQLWIASGNRLNKILDCYSESKIMCERKMNLIYKYGVYTDLHLYELDRMKTTFDDSVIQHRKRVYYNDSKRI